MCHTDDGLFHFEVIDRSTTQKEGVVITGETESLLGAAVRTRQDVDGMWRVEWSVSGSNLTSFTLSSLSSFSQPTVFHIPMSSTDDSTPIHCYSGLSIVPSSSPDGLSLSLPLYTAVTQTMIPVDAV